MDFCALNILQVAAADPVRIPLLTPPWHVIFIVSAYLYFVLKLGRDWMECRKPYNLKRAILIYNLFQVLYNVILLCLASYILIINPLYDWRCMKHLALDHPSKTFERVVIYGFYLNKILDLTDTVFFVLRRSFKQITVLHVFHHTFMVGGFALLYRIYGPGGQYNLMGLLNSFVHIIMYSYYFLAAFNPKMKASLWWKKYITILQLLQFIFLGTYPVVVMIFYPSCPVPWSMHFVQIFLSILMMLMFANFYKQAYLKPKGKKQE